MQCYRNSGPVGSRCLKCSRNRKRCTYPAVEEEEEEEEEKEEEEEEAEALNAVGASSSKGKGKVVDPKTPDQSSSEDSEPTPEGPAVKKKLGSGFLGALSKAVKRKLVDRSPEEAVPPRRDSSSRGSSSRPNLPEAVRSSRYRSVNVSTEDLVLYDPSQGPIPSLPTSSSGSSSNLSIESDYRDIEIFRLERELSRSNSDLHVQTARFNQDMSTQAFRHRQDVEFFQSLLYSRGRGQVRGQARGQGRGLERGRGN